MTPSINPAAAMPAAVAGAAAVQRAAAPAAGAAAASAKAPTAATAPVPVDVPKKTSVDLEEGLKKLSDIVEQMNKEMQSQQRGLSFSYDDAINTHVVTVTSAASGEVIRQIPTEVVVRVAHNMENLKGMLFDGKF